MSSYCGHNAGESYLNAYEVQRLHNGGVAILMGCGSGHLRPAGEYEPFGPVLAYLMSGWYVTFPLAWRACEDPA